MAISLVNSSTASSTNGTLAINAPASCPAGDVLIAWILTRGTSAAITTLSGWTLIGFACDHRLP